MRFAVASVALGVLIGCASAPKAPVYQLPGAPIEGRYEFTAAVPGKAAVGQLVLMRDTVFLIDETKSCGLMQSTGASIRVACRGATPVSENQTYQSEAIAILTFDRRNPALSGTWIMTLPVERKPEPCQRSIVRNGREACESRRTGRNEVNERRTGTVQVRRVPW